MASPNEHDPHYPDQAAADPVLILLPMGRDAAVAVTCLHQAGMRTRVCHELGDFCACLAGAAAGLIAQEALPARALDLLRAALQRQPVWSDVPLIILTTRATTSQTMEQFVQGLGAVGNMTLLERPLNRVTLLSSTVCQRLRSPWRAIPLITTLPLRLSRSM